MASDMVQIGERSVPRWLSELFFEHILEDEGQSFEALAAIFLDVMLLPPLKPSDWAWVRKEFLASLIEIAVKWSYRECSKQDYWIEYESECQQAADCIRQGTTISMCSLRKMAVARNIGLPARLAVLIALDALADEHRPNAMKDRGGTITLARRIEILNLLKWIITGRAIK